MKQRRAALGLFYIILTGVVVSVFVLLLTVSVSGASDRIEGMNMNSHVASDTSCYASYCIQEGDSLWSISSRFKYAGESTSDFMNILRGINNIDSDDIHTGNYLLIPIYDYI